MYKATASRNLRLLCITVTGEKVDRKDQELHEIKMLGKPTNGTRSLFLPSDLTAFYRSEGEKIGIHEFHSCCGLQSRDRCMKP